MFVEAVLLLSSESNSILKRNIFNWYTVSQHFKLKIIIPKLKINWNGTQFMNMMVPTIFLDKGWAGKKSDKKIDKFTRERKTINICISLEILFA